MHECITQTTSSVSPLKPAGKQAGRQTIAIIQARLSPAPVTKLHLSLDFLSLALGLALEFFRFALGLALELFGFALGLAGLEADGLLGLGGEILC